MKKLLFMYGICSISFFSCKKESSNSSNPTPSATSLSGIFEREIYSGTDSAATIRFLPKETKAYEVKLVTPVGEFPYVSGTYSVTGNQITFVSAICPSEDGKYNFNQTSTQLTFSKIVDNCISGEPRSFLISGHWAKK